MNINWQPLLKKINNNHSYKITFISAVVFLLLAPDIYAASVDSTTSFLPAIQGRQRYVNVNNVSSAPTYNNRLNAGIPNFGRATNIQCASNQAITHVSENNQTPTYPATSPSKRAFQSGNYRYDPYCSSASSLLGTCTGHSYMRQINRLDELTVTCGSQLQLPWRSFDIYNPSVIPGDPGTMSTL